MLTGRVKIGGQNHGGYPLMLTMGVPAPGLDRFSKAMPSPVSLG